MRSGVTAPMSSPPVGSGRPTVTRRYCVAKAFGVPIDSDPRALAILHEWVKTTGAEMNEARLRMTRIPKGADLILNKVSGASGFWIGNVIVMAGVPSIMQAMLDEVAPELKIGVRMFSETVRADAREGDIGMQLGEIAKANPEVAIGSYPFFDPQHGANTNVCCAPAMHRSSRRPNTLSTTCWSESGGHNQRVLEPHPCERRERRCPLDPGTRFRAAYPQRRSSNANSLRGQNPAGSPQIYATFQRDNLRRHFGVRASHASHAVRSPPANM